MVDESYTNHYSVAKLAEKVRKTSKKATLELLRIVVTLYVILQEPTVSILNKAAIITALAYFVYPLDIILDFIPLGFTDDLAVLTATLAKVSIYKNDCVRDQVEEILSDWIG